YRQLHVVLHKEFRARRTWADLRAAARRPATLRRGDARRALAAAYHAATLPLARRRLGRLARVPHRGAAPLPPTMSAEAAARPTPQA
ncbi:MAG TPA: hypothetical protein VFL91_09630, partial [Thermomicrobiales bacterium]|nr:hypothetical protein [Thermomicrobiales bacterium]